MAEDIDIEEHDLLEHPIIKKIFPDLSVIKQEIMDFDEGVPEYTEIDNNILKDKHDTATDNLNILDGSTQSNVTNCFQTKVILCSKPGGTNSLKFGLKKEVKVMLQNIKPYLTRTTRFCDICFILYPNSSSLNDHNLSVHTTLHRDLNKDFSKCSNKYKRSLSHGEMTSHGNLNQHRKNINWIDHVNRENTVKQMLKEKNVANTYDLQTNVATNFHKPCFHCHKLFPNQQDLIDHLYSILYAKNVQVFQEHTEINEQDKEIDKNKADLKRNDNINTNIQIEKKRNINESKSIYSCPICSHYFDEETFCRSHCIVKHNSRKDILINTLPFNPNCKFCNLKQDNILSYNTHLRKNHKNEMVKVFPQCNTIDNICSKNGEITTMVNSRRQDNVFQVIVSKIILYKCLECNINFLTYGIAFKHFEHVKFQENWKCTICHRFFKDKDAILHQKQHSCSNYFKIEEVFAEVKPRILYKCSSCGIHFHENLISEHVCKLEQSKSSDSLYCKVCNIFIATIIKPDHDNDHKLRHYTPTNFEIINVESPLLNNDNYELTKKPSSPHNKVKTKNKHKDLLKVSKSLFAKKYLSYNYCNVCKCNICTVHKTDVHLKSLCVNIIKYICQFCGLMFCNKSITAHKRLHLNYNNLKLQDFKFYNLHTNKLMKPLIPEFPKCELCEKHFISKIEIKGHVCDSHDYLICSICKTKFSETAYKLHNPFHSYKNSKIRNKKSNKLNKFKLHYELNNTNDNIVSKHYEMPVIYTCKNCDLSITTYDEVIEHCHLHTNLNKVEVNAIACTVCQLKFANACFSKHLELHTDLPNVKFSEFSFDVMYFGSDNDKWLKHIYKSLPKHKVDTLIRDSIYKYETRIKMEVIQEGLSNLIIYKCEKCQCIIDPNFVYSHIATCCPNSEVSYCTFCDLFFVCSMTRNNHEKIHVSPDITLKSYKIVMFNRELDRNTNYNISNFKKCYVVYECRYCHILVDIYNYNFHVCFRNDCKKCKVCGLLLRVDNFNDHILKHKQIQSFNEMKIKVVLIGNRPEENNSLQKNNDLVPTFNGIVCDYTFYKCMDCEVCVRDARNTVQHSCLIDEAKAQCIKCDLIFGEGKLKGHLKLHDTDPDFTKETILVKPFTNRRHLKTNKVSNNQEMNFKIAKLYKCHCGLHYMQLSALQEHIKKCTGKNKGIQTCSKCCFNFTSDVLFKHLLEHHGDKNTVYKFEIEDS